MFNIDHISISSEHLEETINFYKKFGFESYKEYNDNSVDIVMLYLNNMYYLFCLTLKVPIFNTPH